MELFKILDILPSAHWFPVNKSVIKLLVAELSLGVALHAIYYRLWNQLKAIMVTTVTSKVNGLFICIIFYLQPLSSVIFKFPFNCLYNIYFSLESPYVILPFGQLCNQYNEKELTTLEECQIAATKLNINPPTSEDKSVYPKGCYIFGSSGSSVYFNLHSAGKAHGSMRPICKQSGEFKMLL